MAFGNVGRQVNEALGGSGRTTAERTSKGSNNAGSQAAQKAKAGNLAAGTVTQGAGTSTTVGRAAEQPSAGKIVSEPISQNPNNPRTQNIARSADNYTGEGATPYIADPSLGQVFGSLMNLAPYAGTMNTVGGIANNLMNGGLDFGKVYDGGAVGQMIDKMRGVTPGPVTGASNPNLNGNQTSRGSIVPMAAGAGRVQNDGTPSLADAFNTIISQPGVWPPVRASAGL